MWLKLMSGWWLGRDTIHIQTHVHAPLCVTCDCVYKTVYICIHIYICIYIYLKEGAIEGKPTLRWYKNKPKSGRDCFIIGAREENCSLGLVE